MKSVDSTWLRWIATAAAVETGAAICLYHYVGWLMSPSVAALGVALCLYFGHLLLFRVQCSLLEFLAITTTFGLFAGLVISTPGALKPGLFLAPMIAAWVLYAAVSGIGNANLFGATGSGARLLYMAAALLDCASLPLLGLGVAILLLSRVPRFSMGFYGELAWPFMIAGFSGFVFMLWMGHRSRKRARALLEAAPKEAPLRASITNT